MKKSLSSTLALAAMLAMTACGMGDSSETATAATIADNLSSTEQTAPESIDAQSEAGALNCTINGTIDHENWDASQTAQVSFGRFPASFAEFQQAHKQLAAEPQGAVALQVMAFELYRRNPADGEKALRLNNTEVNCNSTLTQLKEMMNTKDSFYARPYLAAALLKGSTPDNGYTPDEPYTVQMRVNPATKYQNSELLGGKVIYLQVDSKGWDTNWRGVEVVKPNGSNNYVVSNCPALYTQCKKVQGTWTAPK